MPLSPLSLTSNKPIPKKEILTIGAESEDLSIIYNLRPKYSGKGVLSFRIYWTENGIERVFRPDNCLLNDPSCCISGVFVLNVDALSTVFCEIIPVGFIENISEYSLFIKPQVI